ncbi:MAG TPA: serine hydrolase [Ornithinibacter sp.]|nr:serine hydrolase [Ornithinibacter sp.]
MPAALGRRRLLLGGGAAAGLWALAACDDPVTTADAARTAAASSPVATASVPRSATPTPTKSLSAADLRNPKEVAAPRLSARIEEYLDGRSGDLGLELVDLDRGEVFRYDADESECYSTIKVLVLTTVLRQAQEAGADLTKRQRQLARRMITRSDNAATEALLADVGRDELRRVARLVGMDHTTIDDGWFGFWPTVPGDLNAMVGALVLDDAVLDGSRRATARFLMADVVPQQRWGVFAAESDDVHVAAKNGWGPLAGGYRLNSTGWVSGDGREYLLSILSKSPEGFRYGKRTISHVAKICHDALADRLA